MIKRAPIRPGRATGWRAAMLCNTIKGSDRGSRPNHRLLASVPLTKGSPHQVAPAKANSRPNWHRRRAMRYLLPLNMARNDTYSRFMGNAGLFALATAGTDIGINRWGEIASFIGGADFHVDGFITQWAGLVTTIAVRGANIAVAKLWVGEAGSAHFSLADVCQVGVQRPSRTGLNTGNIGTHFTGDIARYKIRGADLGAAVMIK